MQFSLSAAFVALAALVGTAVGETHTVRLNNLCGDNTKPILQARNGTILSDGPDYVSDGSLIGATVYLQDGQCGPAGENCTVVSTTLRNRIVLFPSTTTFDVSPPYGYSVSAAFSYFNGCDGVGAFCNGPQCSAQNVTVRCDDDDVGLAVTFCA